MANATEMMRYIDDNNKLANWDDFVAEKLVKQICFVSWKSEGKLYWDEDVLCWVIMMFLWCS